MKTQFNKTSSAVGQRKIGSLRWARIAMLMLVFVLLLLGVFAAHYYTGGLDTAMSPMLGAVAAALVLGLFSVLNSQTAGSRIRRSGVPIWQQVALGLGMTLAQLLGMLCIYLLGREILPSVTLSSGLFVVVVGVSVAFVPLVLFVIWQLGHSSMNRLSEIADPAAERTSGARTPRSGGSQLIGWRFWMWFAVVATATALLFGLERRLAPYPYLGVEKGVYLSTLYVVLFVLLLQQAVALYLRHRGRRNHSPAERVKDT